MMLGYKELKALGITATPFRIRQWIRESRFPRPIKGGRAHRDGPFKFDSRQIDAWLKSSEAEKVKKRTEQRAARLKGARNGKRN